MYKTVRHGENSLQYTILPQQDDAAAITAANNNICGRISAGVRRRARRGRTATILIMTLILACGVVGAAVVVPLLVSTDVVALPSALRRFGSNNNGHHHGGHHGHHAVSLQRNKTVTAYNTSTVASGGAEPTSESTTTSPTSKADPTSTNVSPSLLPDDVITTTKTPVQVTLSLTTEEAGIRATTQQQGPAEIEGLLEEAGGGKEHDRVGGSKKKALDEDMTNSTTRSFVFAATDSKNMSVLEQTTEANVGLSTEQPKHKSWLEIHWPYVYPSSYFQWTVSLFCYVQTPYI
jgi:phage tail protein X